MDLTREETTFKTDFKIAIPFGINAIKDTYKNCLEFAESDYKIFTELVMALNHLSWELHFQHKEQLAELFAKLYYDADARYFQLFGEDKEAMRFFIKVTD